MKSSADAVGVKPAGALKAFQTGKPHEPGKAFLRLKIVWNGMGLPIVLHLKAMLDVTQKSVSVNEFASLRRAKEFVLDEFLQGGQGLGALKERLVAGMEQLQRLRDEFDFTDAARA